MTKIFKGSLFIIAVVLLTSLFMADGGAYFLYIMPPLLSGLLVSVIITQGNMMGLLRYTLPLGVCAAFFLLWYLLYLGDPFGLAIFGMWYFVTVFPVLIIFAGVSVRKRPQPAKTVPTRTNGVLLETRP